METQNGVEIERTTDALGRDTGFSLGPDFAVQYGYDAMVASTASPRPLSPLRPRIHTTTSPTPT